jgi:hypothetical protein
MEVSISLGLGSFLEVTPIMPSEPDHISCRIDTRTRDGHRLSFRALTAVLALSLAFAFGASCSLPPPEKAGDACETDGDPCPDKLICAKGGDDDGNICQVPVGGACDPKNKTPFCASKTECVSDAKGGGTCGIPLGGACDPAASKCGGNLVCAELESGEHKCFLPVLITGTVFDTKTTSPVVGAHVIALDGQSTAVTDVAITGAEGKYELDVPTVRVATGEPVPGFFKSSFTMRSSAAGYQTFPGGIRTALPIDANSAKQGEAGWVIETPLTKIALVPLPEGQLGRVSIAGQVKAEKGSAGVLVVAESEKESATALSDASGHYTIFNVADGSYTVSGYAVGLQLKPAPTTVQGKAVTGVDLAQSPDALGSIKGSLQFADAAGGAGTSVVLVVASTFSDTFVRGEVPRGLRTPLSGPPSVTGEFTINDVPQGNYVVLAAFEDDHLVLDPDPNISGTQIVKVKMEAPGTSITLESSFKVTGSLVIKGPGAQEAEAVSEPVTFSWVDDASEVYYSIVVYDSYGNTVWENLMLPSVSGGDVTVPYGGPKLEQGLYYQFRATSWRTPGGKPGPISKTEDLLGVFYLK